MAWILILLWVGAVLSNQNQNQRKEALYEVLKSDLSCEKFNSSQEQDFCLVAKQCVKYFDQEMLPQISLHVFRTICGELSVNSSDVILRESSPTTKPSSGEVWGYGLLMVTLISLTSVVGVGVLPLMSKSFYSNLLTSLIGLAVGSLAGSAVFHLIPSAFRLAELELYPHHSYLNISLTIWAGLYLFFIIERFLKIFMDAKARRQGESIPGHGHSHNNQNGVKASSDHERRLLQCDHSLSSLETVTSPLTDSHFSPEKEEEQSNCVGSIQDKSILYSNSKSAIRASFGHQDKPHPVTRPTVEDVRSLETGASGNKIATVAWMIIFGDGIHNFIDGLSIGAAFSESILTGISVSLAVLCEEFPHELGDFAVLLNSGMTMKQAMMYNFLSACTCYLGLVLGILLGELDANCYIFALAGGMFLYISLVDMVPELNETVEVASRTSVGKAVRVFCLQNVGILTGIVSLFILARFQDDIQIGL
jgi:zinc transporter 14